MEDTTTGMEAANPAFPAAPRLRFTLPIILFLLTLITTTITGMFWLNITDLRLVTSGLTYSFAILFILTCHEFGHFFAARYHRVATTLPYYIPLFPIPALGMGFGTMGAVIRIKEPIRTRRALFDIGVAGPIAGFAASLLLLFWGFTHLPGTEFLLGIHDDFDFTTGTAPSFQPGESLAFGKTLLYDFLSRTLPAAGDYVPPMTEMYHYPFLITGWFGLFITALNLLPVGQLDGGHVTYAMFGPRQRTIARAFTALVVVSGALGMLPLIGALMGFEDSIVRMLQALPWWTQTFWSGWLIWAVLIFTVFRIAHPEIADPEPLGPGRMAIGWFALLIFVVSFTPVPFLLL